MSMMILDLLVHHLNSRVKILNWFDNDPHSTDDEIIAKTSLSHGTIERIIHDCLNTKKVTSGWVPHQLIHEKQVKFCRENLTEFQNGSWRLYNIITGDERRIYHRQIHHQ